jgi:hypothetical protein
MLLDAYDTDTKNKSLWQLMREYELTFLDPSFQRNGGVERGSGWTEEECKEYIHNLLNGRTSNFIIRAHIERCLAFALEVNDYRSADYFKEALDRGYNYISIDGNNTHSSVFHYITNKLPSKDLTTEEEIYLSQYDEERQNDIQHVEKIQVLTLRRISYLDMCHLFRYLNKSVQLNAQEYRQAMPTALSKFIRDISNRGAQA